MRERTKAATEFCRRGGEKLNEIGKASPLWDGQMPGLRVTDLTDRMMELRCLMFDLRGVVREQMIAWIVATYPQAVSFSAGVRCSR